MFFFARYQYKIYGQLYKPINNIQGLFYYLTFLENTGFYISLLYTSFLLWDSMRRVIIQTDNKALRLPKFDRVQTPFKVQPRVLRQIHCRAFCQTKFLKIQFVKSTMYSLESNLIVSNNLKYFNSEPSLKLRWCRT